MSTIQLIRLLKGNLLLLLIIIGCSDVVADDTDTDSYIDTTIIRDNTYYPYGMSNPFSDKKRSMYWRDSNDVLNNLHLFQSLAVRFHSCVYVHCNLLQWKQKDPVFISIW
jgi:hypothetical protein